MSVGKVKLYTYLYMQCIMKKRKSETVFQFKLTWYASNLLSTWCKSSELQESYTRFKNNNKRTNTQPQT